MAFYLKKNKVRQYDEYLNDKLLLPNISYDEDNNHVYYLNPPNNKIFYESNYKLSETTRNDYTSGLHVNAFNGENDKLSIINHKFENGKGTIEFNEDIITIGNYAFYETGYLKKIIIPNKVTTIETGAFSRCNDLTHAILGRNIISIKSSAFSCPNLISINIPNKVTTIESSAFSTSRNLTSIKIPNSVTSIGSYAFNGSYIANSNFINYSSLDASENNYWGCKICDIEYKGLLIKNSSIISSRTNISSVAIPNNITSIGDSSFEHNTNLTEIIIPNNVITIGTYAFRGCENLENVTISDSITNIGNGAFTSCYYLKNMTVNAITPPTLGTNVFYEGLSSSFKICVPSESVELYKNASGWSDLSSKIQAIS